MHQLIKKIIIEGYVEAITGLHIGGTKDSMSIGELDNAVIRNPISKEPYIPGSSLKGKMRCLLELTHSTIGDKRMSREIENPPTNNPDHLAAQLFGFTGSEGEKKQQPSRIIVRDGKLRNTEQLGREFYTEVKSETVIDRITSAAMPRQLERVPAGAEFDLNIVLNIFSDDKDEEAKNKGVKNEKEEALIKGLFNALQLVQDDYLGGSGSRGSGQVKFVITKIEEKTNAYYQAIDNTQPTNVTLDYQSKYIPESIEVKMLEYA